VIPQGADLSRAHWQASRRSGSNGGPCVEVARNLPGVVTVRDSRDPHGGTLLFSHAQWAAFLAMVTGQSPGWWQTASTLLPSGSRTNAP